MENVDNKPNSKNYCLLLFEILACIFITFIHVRFPGEVGQYVVFIGRFGVPLFFMVSGYFMLNGVTTKEELRNKIKKRIIRISLLLLFSSVLYFIINISCNASDPIGYLSSTFSLNNLYCFLLFNQSFLITPNWFLLAMIYVYFLVLIFPNLFLKSNIFLIITSSLSVIGTLMFVLLRNVDVYFAGLRIGDAVMFRNWLFNALPVISIGIILSKLKEKLNRLSNKFIIVSLCVTLILMVGELDLYRRLLGIYVELGFFTIILVSFIIALSIKYPNLLANVWFMNIRCKWTPFVYVLHSAFISLVGSMLYYAPNNVFIEILRPILVISITIPVAIGIGYLLLFIKEKRNSNRELNEKPE